jgi:hypothetical protein
MPDSDLSLTCRSTALARFWSGTRRSPGGDDLVGTHTPRLAIMPMATVERCRRSPLWMSYSAPTRSPSDMNVQVRTCDRLLAPYRSQMVANRTLRLLPCFFSLWPPIRRGVGVDGGRRPLRELLGVFGSDSFARAGEVLALVS